MCLHPGGIGLKNENKNVREKVRENPVLKIFEVLGFGLSQAAFGQTLFSPIWYMVMI